MPEQGGGSLIPDGELNHAPAFKNEVIFRQGWVTAVATLTTANAIFSRQHVFKAIKRSAENESGFGTWDRSKSRL